MKGGRRKGKSQRKSTYLRTITTANGGQDLGTRARQATRNSSTSREPVRGYERDGWCRMSRGLEEGKGKSNVRRRYHKNRGRTSSNHDDDNGGGEKTCKRKKSKAWVARELAISGQDGLEKTKKFHKQQNCVIGIGYRCSATGITSSEGDYYGFRASPSLTDPLLPPTTTIRTSPESTWRPREGWGHPPITRRSRIPRHPRPARGDPPDSSPAHACASPAPT